MLCRIEFWEHEIKSVCEIKTVLITFHQPISFTLLTYILLLFLFMLSLLFNSVYTIQTLYFETQLYQKIQELPALYIIWTIWDFPWHVICGIYLLTCLFIPSFICPFIHSFILSSPSPRFISTALILIPYLNK
jgi:hypothetical protein